MTPSRAARRSHPSTRAVYGGLLSAWCVLATAAQAGAQVYQFDGGSSSLFEAHGGSFQLRTGDSTVRLSAGDVHGGLAAGMLLRHRLADWSVSAGDDVINFDLPSDVFGGGHNV